MLKLKRYWHAVALDNSGNVEFNSARLVKFSHQPAAVQYLLSEHAGLGFTSLMKRHVSASVIMYEIFDSCILDL
jgi:hypothetical protein